MIWHRFHDTYQSDSASKHNFPTSRMKPGIKMVVLATKKIVNCPTMAKERNLSLERQVQQYRSAPEQIVIRLSSYSEKVALE